MANQTGISIVIKAFLPTGKSLDDQFNALSKVKEAHESGDYSTLLAAATIEEVKTEQKTRRVSDVVTDSGQKDIEDVTADAKHPGQTSDDEGVPEFLKKGKAA